MASHRPTLDVIAAELGVSRTTVSNAFGRPDQLSAALRERVLAAAARHGYAGPDPIARGLARGRLGVVGLLLAGPTVHALADPALRSVLDGIVDELAAARTSLLLVPHTAEPEAVTSAPVDGFVVVSAPEGDPLVEAAVHRGLPVVALDQPRRAGVPVLRIDDRGGARQAARHVAALGHRRVGIVTLAVVPGGPAGLVDPAGIVGPAAPRGPYPLTADRLAGYLAGLAPGSRAQVWQAPLSHRAAGRAAAAGLLAADPGLTAILASSDELAFGAIDHLVQSGRRVPDDVSVVGFDDVAEAATAPIPLTTVRQDLPDRARSAARLALDLIGGAPTPKLPVRRVRLVVRASTAPAPP